MEKSFRGGPVVLIQIIRINACMRFALQLDAQKKKPNDCSSG